MTVFGVVKHNGCVKAIPIAARNHAEIMGEIQAHTCEGSLYYSDECQNYAMLRPRGGHVMICKEKGRPLKCDHINGIKCSWSYAKNSLYPLRGLPTKYLHLYLAEVCRLLNQRNEDLKPSLKQMPTTLPISCIKPVLVQEGLESPFEMDPTYGHGNEIRVFISFMNHRGSISALGEAVCAGSGCHAAPAGGEVPLDEFYFIAAGDKSQRNRATFGKIEVLEVVSPQVEWPPFRPDTRLTVRR